MFQRLRGARTNQYDFVLAIHNNANPRHKAITPAHRVTDFDVGDHEDIFKDGIDILTFPQDVLPEHIMSRMVYLLKYQELDCREALTVYIALTERVNFAFRAQLDRVMGDCKVELREIEYERWIQDNRFEVNEEAVAFWSVRLKPQHYVLTYCIISLLMGKYLEGNNYSQWFKSRLRSFTSPLGLSATDPYLTYFQILMSTCQSLHNGIRIYWQVRKTFFLNIFNIANQPHLLGVGCLITINLLRCSEMANWNFIQHWIIRLHPDLLMWNEMGKFLPAMSAAYTKYISMGVLADWGKLILPPEELTEFANTDLQVPFTVAREIAARYGNLGVRNIKSSIDNSLLQEILDHAMLIVESSGGAMTMDTMALRRWRYGPHINVNLTTLQNSSAGEIIEDVREDRVRPGIGDAI